MCWSAEADAPTGALVTGLGAACRARVRGLRRLPLAALPLLLGLHRPVEALVWLGAEDRLGAGASAAARTAWALVALPLLPALVPYGVWLAAPPGPGRRLSGLLPVPGAAAAAVVLLTWSGGRTPAADGGARTGGAG